MITCGISAPPKTPAAVPAGRACSNRSTSPTPVNGTRQPATTANTAKITSGVTAAIGYAAESGLKLAGGEALGSRGEVPLLIVNKIGQGSAILLNAFVDQYPRRVKLGVAADMKRLIANVLRKAGVEPEVVARTDEGHRLMVVRYRSGGASYVGVLRDPSEGQSEVGVRLPGASHVYDVRAGKYLGKTDRIRRTTPPGRAELYALLPYAVKSVAVEAPARVKRGGEIACRLRVMPDGEAAGMHVLRSEVRGPDGEPRAHYGEQMTCPKGAGGAGFRLALNDPPGKWEITAMDVATGVTGSASFEVE